jgi:hypothetical protein
MRYVGPVLRVRFPVLAQGGEAVERTILMHPEAHKVAEQALLHLLALLNLCTS